MNTFKRPTKYLIKNGLLRSIAFILFTGIACMPVLDACEFYEPKDHIYHTRTYENLFLCLPEKLYNIPEYTLTAADRRIATDILCALGGLPKAIILGIILPYYANKQFAHYRAINLFDHGPLSEPHPMQCKITNDGYLITIQHVSGTWKRYNIKTGLCDIYTFIPAIADHPDYSCHPSYNISDSGESLIILHEPEPYGNHPTRRCMIAIDRQGKQLSFNIDQEYNNIQPSSQVLFLPNQQVIVSEKHAKRSMINNFVKYDMHTMQPISNYLLNKSSCIMGFSLLDKDHLVAYIRTIFDTGVRARRTSELIQLTTKDLSPVADKSKITVDQIHSGHLHNLGNGHFLIDAAQRPVNNIDEHPIIMNIDNNPILCNGHAFDIPVISNTARASKNIASSPKGTYALVDINGDVLLGDTRKESLMRVFSKIAQKTDRISIDLCKGKIAVHNHTTNTVHILGQAWAPDFNDTSTQSDEVRSYLSLQSYIQLALPRVRTPYTPPSTSAWSRLLQYTNTRLANSLACTYATASRMAQVAQRFAPYARYAQLAELLGGSSLGTFASMFHQ